jgi:hypothetical protein
LKNPAAPAGFFHDRDVHAAFSRKPPQSVKTRLAAISTLGETVFLNRRIESRHVFFIDGAA